MKHLISIKDLSPKEIEKILDRANHHAEINRHKNKKQASLNGLTLINLFIENSTRTITSFELAGRRLGLDVITMSADSSSLRKGESLLDMAQTLNAMHPDFIVIRHQEAGTAEFLARNVNCAVINAGDGTNEHPTQALLDAVTIRNEKAKLKDLDIAICGDIKHSRVARSNIYLLNKMGSNVRIVAPKEFMPPKEFIDENKIAAFTNMEEGIKNTDVVMMLRIQKERISDIEELKLDEYFKRYGLDSEKLRHAKPDAIVMHPGPINREVEISSEIADDPSRSVILKQVEMGVAIRQAVLEELAKN